MLKPEEIIFHFNKGYLQDPSIPMWVIKSRGESHYVHHVDVDKGVGFSTKETPDKSTKGSLKFKGVLSISMDNDKILARISEC